MISIEPKSQGTDTVLSGSKVPQGLWQDDTVWPASGPAEQEESSLASEESSWGRPRLVRDGGARLSIC